MQLAQRPLGDLGLRALHAETMAAAAYLHIEPSLEQAQVGIERSAQARQPGVVRRLQLELAGDGDRG
jgi:hypothetical protein